MTTAFHLRWVLVAAGIALGIALGIRKAFSFRWPTLPRAALAALSLTFLALALAAKYSQLAAFQLNGQDFWLFQDMIEQMGRGGFMLTRFAPQSTGWVQHGVVHPYFTLALLVPISWAVGSVHACLWLGPLAMAGAGAMLGALAKPRWGAPAAFALASAFLASSLVGRIVMYDVHPEALYPLATFAWAWAAGWGDGEIRPGALLLATLALMGIKTDSFLVLYPLIALWIASRAKRPARAWLVPIGVVLIALGVTLAQFAAVRNWGDGTWGPREWQGFPVIIPQGAGALKGHHWDTPASALRILAEIVDEKGGWLALLGGFARTLVSRPLLSLLALAPWAALSGAFWLAALPLLAVYSLLSEPGRFVTYYSAPFLGVFWLAAIGAGPFRVERWLGSASRKARAALWTLMLSLLLGGAGLEFHRLTSAGRKARDDAQALVACLSDRAPRGLGVVSSRFLGLLPHDRVWSDRAELPPPPHVTFFLFASDLPSFELPPSRTELLWDSLRNDAHWVEIGTDCRIKSQSEKSGIHLYVKV